MPMKMGIQCSLLVIAIQPLWIPAYVGMTGGCSFPENALTQITGCKTPGVEITSAITSLRYRLVVPIGLNKHPTNTICLLETYFSACRTGCPSRCATRTSLTAVTIASGAS